MLAINFYLTPEFLQNGALASLSMAALAWVISHSFEPRI